MKKMAKKTNDKITRSKKVIEVITLVKDKYGNFIKKGRTHHNVFKVKDIVRICDGSYIDNLSDNLPFTKDRRYRDHDFVVVSVTAKDKIAVSDGPHEFYHVPMPIKIKSKSTGNILYCNPLNIALQRKPSDPKSSFCVQYSGDFSKTQCKQIISFEISSGKIGRIKGVSGSSIPLNSSRPNKILGMFCKLGVLRKEVKVTKGSNIVYNYYLTEYGKKAVTDIIKKFS